ncbi:MAG: OadG family protein [Firmicutes bacterium]|jgi:Na+-transporting methylmalonyl-CoA/oxaloacetate decarboxylase gamma subunit|nr:OadG family protein [Bacillota bacterium]
MTLGGSLYVGIQTLLVGMLVTFVGLAALQFIIRAMATVTARRESSPSEGGAAAPRVEARQAAPQANAEEAVAAAAAAAMAAASGARTDEEVAAIGAVLALLASEGARGASIGAVRKVSPASTALPNLWGLAGRYELMTARQEVIAGKSRGM